jgi:hypothetical protein
MGLSTLPSHGPVHFRPPIAGPVLSLNVRAPFPVPRGLPAKGPVCNEENCHPGEPLWGSARSSSGAPIHRLHFTARFRVLEFSSACARPRAAVVDEEGVGLLGELFGPARCHPLPRSSPRGPWPLHLRPHPDSPARSPPRRHVVHAGSWNEVSAGRGTAC